MLHNKLEQWLNIHMHELHARPVPYQSQAGPWCGCLPPAPQMMPRLSGPPLGVLEEGGGLAPPPATRHFELATTSWEQPPHVLDLPQDIPIPGLFPLSPSILLPGRPPVLIFGFQKLVLMSKVLWPVIVYFTV